MAGDTLEGSFSSESSSSDTERDALTHLIENPQQEFVERKYSRNLLKRSSLEQGQDVVAFIDGDWHSDIKEKYHDASTCKTVSGAPKDRYHLTYIIFYLLGFGTLLPWNFFITANGYFKVKLSTDVSLQRSFQNYFSLASMVPNVLTMIANVMFLHRLNRWKCMSAALVVMFSIFVLTTALVVIDTDEWTGTFFAITISSMVLICSCSAVLQGGLFGVTGMLPTRYTQAVMVGQGLGGLFAASVSIFTLLGNSDIFRSTFAYFCCAAVVILFCLLGFFVIQKLEFIKYYIGGKKYTCTCKCDAFMHDHMVDFVNEDALAAKKLESGNIKEKKEGVPYLKICRQIAPMAVSVCFVFFVTLSTFPSISARIVSVNASNGSKWTNVFFVPVTCFLFFNLGDYLGRVIAGFVQKPGSRGPWLMILCIARAVFIPLFVFCNAQPRPNGAPVLFNHDAAPIVLMLLFAISNGYLGSLAMMYGPRAVDSENAAVAGTMMAFALVIGLATGAAFSFVPSMFL